jgi:hypothetical protein
VREFVPKYLLLYPKVAFLFPRKWIRNYIVLPEEEVRRTGTGKNVVLPD